MGYTAAIQGKFSFSKIVKENGHLPTVARLNSAQTIMYFLTQRAAHLIYTGTPIWTHDDWFGSLFPSSLAKDKALAQYAQYFNSVEGNTSFYHIPDEKTVKRWAEMVPDDFRFTFKFHQSISHDKKLHNIDAELALALERFSLLGNKLGCLMLQLPASFGPEHLGLLSAFIAQLPSELCSAVEVRHLKLFDKSADEQAFNKLLVEKGINRIIMDTRGLFSCPANGDAIIEDAQRKKPRVPTNAIATAQHPVVRFVGHPVIEENARFYRPWIHKTKQWLDEGKSPYLFFHSANRTDAPWLAEAFFNDLKAEYPDIATPRIELPKQRADQLDIFGS